MQLFNASSLFSEDAKQNAMGFINDPEALRQKLVEIKESLIKMYNFKAYNAPQDFTTSSYVIATNHLTDSDAPLIISYYYQVMTAAGATDPKLFVFAKENCFNGVSIPRELLPILSQEKVIEVDRNSLGGSKAAMQAAKAWFNEGAKPKHYLIFSQGTIYDINKDVPEDIESGAFWLARLLGIPVLPGFIEQAVEGEENRLIFGAPIPVPRDCRQFDDCKKLWLERVIEAQNQLGPLTGRPARPAVLDAAHQTRKRFKPNT